MIIIAQLIFILALLGLVLTGLIVIYHWWRFGWTKLNLNSGEELVLTVRRYWLVFALQNIFLLVLAILPLFFGPLLVSLLAASIVITPVAYHLLYAAWLLFLIAAFVVNWTTYYLDAWQVTTERLVDVDQIALFIRHEATTELGKIQDLSISTPGVLATIFHFGTIRVQTAGEHREFAMAYVPHPEQVKARILALAAARAAQPQKVEVVA